MVSFPPKKNVVQVTEISPGFLGGEGGRILKTRIFNVEGLLRACGGSNDHELIIH